MKKGTVVLIFQPAEEKGNGAKHMIDAGVLEGIEAIFGGHVHHQYSTGVIASRPGTMLAGCAFFRAVISGKEESRCDDPVLAASSVVISLQGIVAREANPLDSKVVSVTLFQGSDKVDRAPDAVVIAGTFRAFSDIYELLRRIKQVITEQAKVFRCSATVDFFENESSIYPPTVNDVQLHEHVKNVATNLFGPTKFQVAHPVMGAEDFSFYSELIPASFYFVGIRNEALGAVHSGHSPLFMIDEDALPIGAVFHAAVVERYLDERESSRLK